MARKPEAYTLSQMKKVLNKTGPVSDEEFEALAYLMELAHTAQGIVAREFRVAARERRSGLRQG